MGVSASASVFVGFLVTRDDFWTETTTKSSQPECSNGHPGPAGKFCQECGGKIGIQTRKFLEPTPNFKAFCDARKLVPEETWAPNDDLYFDEILDRSAFEGLDLECVDAIDGSDHEKQYVALGVSALGVSDICSVGGGDPRALGVDEIQALFKQAGDIRDALKLDRPVKLFLTAYCSY